MNELIVKCELCGEIIAKTTENAMSFPMTGGMFMSPDETHGLPAPFDKGLAWEDFRCPYGRIHRPMISQDTILTAQGHYRVAKNGEPGCFVKETGEIDRSAVIDRALSPTDEQAEAIVRADMGTKAAVNETKAPDGEMKSEGKPTESVPHETMDGKKPCEICGKPIHWRGKVAHMKKHKDVTNA